MGGEWIFISDDDGHWYVIPLHLEGRFNELLKEGVDTDDYANFFNEFGHMSSDGPRSYVFTEWRYRD